MKVRQVLCLALVALFAATSFGQDASVRWENEDLSDLVPGSVTTNIFVTTPGDILSLENVTLSMDGAELFQSAAPFGPSINGDQCASFGMFDPSICADSFLRTQEDKTLQIVLVNDGSAAMTPAGIPLSTWGDLEDIGAVTDFQIGRFTSIPGDAMPSFLVGSLEYVGSDGNTQSLPFSVPIGVPEPASAALSLLAGLALFAFRRR